MYGYLPITTDVALPVAGMADVTGAILNFAVEEDEMMVNLGFTATILAGGAASQIDFQFMVDGVAATAFPSAGLDITVAAKKAFLAMPLVVRLSKGRHVVKLQANATAAASIKGTAYDCRLFAKRETADAVLAHGVDSKVQVTM
jgi:hypothetical protein